MCAMTNKADIAGDYKELIRLESGYKKKMPTTIENIAELDAEVDSILRRISFVSARLANNLQALARQNDGKQH